MQEWIEIVTRAFDTSGFPPRWYCGQWSLPLGWLHILSDSAIAFAYVSISAILFYFRRHRPDVPFSRVFALFAAFIVCCGVGHLIEAIIFWHPIYRFAGIWKSITAAVSVTTAVVLAPIIPEALRIPGILRTNAKLKQALDRVQLLRTEQEELASGAAHCLKEPLRGIELRLSKVLDLDESHLSEVTRDEITQARALGERLYHMLDELLLHANLVAIPLDPSSFSIATDIKHLVQEELPQEVELQLQSSKKGPLLASTDRSLFTWGLRNCLKWVSKTMNHAHPRLTVTIEKSRIEELGKEDEPWDYQLTLTFQANAIETENFDHHLNYFFETEFKESLALSNRIFRRLGGGIQLRHEERTKDISVLIVFSDGDTNQEQELI